MAYDPYKPELEPRDEYPFYRVDFEKDLGGGPGTLIRPAQLMSGYATLDEASATYRVIYESTSGMDCWRGEPIGVSGMIAFPKSTERPWRVVSWAHGTVGSADQGAPSLDEYVGVDPAPTGLGLLRKINKAPHELLNAFLRAGWVVAMTDYEGLGTYGIHPFLLGDSEGRGILDIVPAVRHLAGQVRISHQIADEYVIVGHSQGGQAALFAASMHGTYATPGRLVGVAALAPASNLKGQDLFPPDDGPENGLLKAYQSPTADPGVVGDVGGFYPLFTNGVLGGDRDLKPEDLFQPNALIQFSQDRDELARAELSDPAGFWMTTPPLAVIRPNGIFKQQRTLAGAMTPAWAAYWRQVEGFTPKKLITVPIRVSQAKKDPRVMAEKTRMLLTQLKGFPGRGPVTEVFYGTVAEPDPPSLEDHFGLLVDPTEIDDVVRWASHPLEEDTEIER